MYSHHVYVPTLKYTGILFMYVPSIYLKYLFCSLGSGLKWVKRENEISSDKTDKD